jgi:hypothetical protein
LTNSAADPSEPEGKRVCQVSIFQALTNTENPGSHLAHIWLTSQSEPHQWAPPTCYKASQHFLEGQGKIVRRPCKNEWFFLQIFLYFSGEKFGGLGIFLYLCRVIRG